jgi:hypothetical protein
MLAAPSPPDGLHPRNPHCARYDFARLVAALPALAAHVRPHPVEGDTIDFADPAAVLALNRALLLAHHDLVRWDLPPGALCPPVPGRADYLCHVADLLPPGAPAGDVAVLEIGTGAGCIYPLLGARLLGWSFVATDIAPESLRWAADLLAAQSFSVTQIVMLALSFVTPAFMQFVVREREVSAKHQQFISGVSVLAYWLSNFVFDLACYYVPAVLAMILSAAFNISSFTSTDYSRRTAFVLSFLLFGPALVSFTTRRSSLTRGSAPSASAPSSGPSLDEASLETGAL